MKSCNCNCNDEHYVVRPNIPVYDWDYDYDVSSNTGRCKCDNGMAQLIDSMDAIRNNVSALQDLVRENASSNIWGAIEVLNEKVKKLENGTSGGTGTIDVINLTELAQNVLDEMERHPEQYNFANIGSNDLTELLNKVSELEGKVNNLPSPTLIETLINKVDTLETRIIENTGGKINVTLEGKVLVITGDNIEVVV